MQSPILMITLSDGWNIFQNKKRTIFESDYLIREKVSIKLKLFNLSNMRLIF